MAKPKEGMARIVLYIPKTLHERLEQIKQKDGVSLSQQARYSLSLWCRRVEKDPYGAWGLIGSGVRDGWRSTGGKGFTDPAQDAPQKAQTDLQHALWVMEHPEADPEPNIHTEPVKWGAWSARQGNAAVKVMAAGYFGHPDPKGSDQD
jgi:hypothetical protein